MHRRILFITTLVGFAWITATTVWCERLVAQELHRAPQSGRT